MNAVRFMTSDPARAATIDLERPADCRRAFNDIVNAGVKEIRSFEARAIDSLLLLLPSCSSLLCLLTAYARRPRWL